MLSFGFTVLGTGGCNCCIRYPLVTRGFDDCRRFCDRSTGLALLFRFMPIFCTGSWLIFLCLYNVIMFCFFGNLRLLFEHFFAELTTLSI